MFCSGCSDHSEMDSILISLSLHGMGRSRVQLAKEIINRYKDEAAQPELEVQLQR